MRPRHLVILYLGRGIAIVHLDIYTFNILGHRETFDMETFFVSIAMQGHSNHVLFVEELDEDIALFAIQYNVYPQWLSSLFVHLE